MGQRQLSQAESEKPKRPQDRANELRSILRIDWVVYTVIAVVCILSLAGLHPGVQVDHAVVGTLITFVTGVIAGLFTYLRYKANGNDEPEGEKSTDGTE
jgi:hypothetical protein